MRTTTEGFIKRATEVHNGKYDYSKTVYVNNYTKVCIICPETCCFVPQRINTLFAKRQRQRGALPIGVCNNGKKFRGELQKDGKKVKFESRDTIHEAFCDYKFAKEAYIKEIADEYKERLEPRVYEALLNYKVEITD